MKDKIVKLLLIFITVFTLTSCVNDNNIKESFSEGTYMDLAVISQQATIKNMKSFNYEDGKLKLLTNKVNVYDPIIIFSSQEELVLGELRNRYRWFTIEMSATKGVCGMLTAYVKGDKESKGITFPINSDGDIHRYTIDLTLLYDSYNRENGMITKWGLIAADQGDAEVVISKMGFGMKPLGTPYLDVNIDSLYRDIVTVNKETVIPVEVSNIASTNSKAVNIKFDEEVFKIPAIKPGERYTVNLTRKFTKPGVNTIDVSVKGQPQKKLNIIAYREPEDITYVPVPVPVESDYLIGAFNYSGWFDKSKWQPIVPLLDRKPLLGWYREDDPVAMDWQIKWAVENGISFFTFNWYRTKGTADDPVGVAEGFNDAAEKALPGARYKDMIKYALMWNNNNNHPVKQGAKDRDELLNVLAPYWMEKHFKQSNYLTINNKPVFYIWQVKEFISDMGGIKEAESALNDLNAYAKYHGFDGIYYIGNYIHTNPAHEESKAIGIDAAYYYIAGVNAKAPGTVIEKQKNYLNSRSGQADKVDMMWIPTASMGWDILGWNISDNNRWISTPREFADVLLMNKAYIDNKKYENKEQKMLMLAVWNEYGEGHYIMPTTKYGFGYLNVIREVFSDSSAALDITPEDIGMRIEQIITPEEECKYRIKTYWSLDDLLK